MRNTPMVLVFGSYVCPYHLRWAVSFERRHRMIILDIKHVSVYCGCLDPGNSVRICVFSQTSYSYLLLPSIPRTSLGERHRCTGTPCYASNGANVPRCLEMPLPWASESVCSWEPTHVTTTTALTGCRLFMRQTFLLCAGHNCSLNSFRQRCFHPTFCIRRFTSWHLRLVW